MTDVPNITLNAGVDIPQLGFGVFQIDPSDTVDAVLAALEVGYRHVDTAQMYGNEAEVGEAVRKSGVPRDEVFVTSKLNNDAHDPAGVPDALDRTLDALGFDVLDLFLIHWPMPAVGDFVETWRAMSELPHSGKVRAVGVSNFQPHHLQRLLDAGLAVPAVNQVEVHPYFRQDAVRAFDAEHGIVTEAWSPIARGEVLHDPTIVEIADRTGRTPAQVTLRWHLQRGDVVFPKSVSPERMAENFAMFGWELTPEDMSAIDHLDRDARRGPDPDTFNRT
jgi:2,5-diketo-D-gluconate reductase A